jgi:hypothetical protein
VLVIGVIMLLAGVAMAVSSAFLPSAALPGLIGGAAGLMIAGSVMAYLDWPERKPKAAAGRVRADAWILDVGATTAEVTGYRMVEVTLEVRPKDGVPFRVKRKFVANRARFQPGESVRVEFEPIDPERVELV